MKSLSIDYRRKGISGGKWCFCWNGLRGRFLWDIEHWLSGVGLVQKEGFEAQDGAFQKCWAIYPEETIIAALFTKLGHGSNLDVH